MPRHAKYVPTHRDATAEPALKKNLRKSVMFSGVAVAATGLAVTSGVFVKDAPADSASGVLSAARADHADDPVTGEAVRDRQDDVSRSDGRANLDDKLDALNQDSGGMVTKTEDLTSQDPRDIARALLPEFGFADSEFECLDALYDSESGWDMHADNPVSSAYGIPQALTAGTHDLPSDYMTNPVSQIRWGLEYIRDSYGTPCSAWEFKQSHNWY